MGQLKLALMIVGVLVVVMIMVVFTATYSFEHRVKGEVKELFGSIGSAGSAVIKEGDLAGLPVPVQRWLEQAEVVGKERIRTVRLKQEALLRLEKEKPWLATSAEQYFTVDEPGFIWKADIKAA